MKPAGGYLEKAAKAEVYVTKLPGDRLSEAAGILVRSYHDHPNSIDFFPDAKVRARALPDVCATGFRDALGFGYVYGAIRGGKIVGVATQGLGAGTRLLEPVLSLADAAGQSCYLETQTARDRKAGGPEGEGGTT